jgi:hypothetical protein
MLDLARHLGLGRSSVTGLIDRARLAAQAGNVVLGARGVG